MTYFEEIKKLRNEIEIAVSHIVSNYPDLDHCLDLAMEVKSGIDNIIMYLHVEQGREEERVQKSEKL